jgi:hypothetical protein
MAYCWEIVMQPRNMLNSVMLSALPILCVALAIQGYAQKVSVKPTPLDSIEQTAVGYLDSVIDELREVEDLSARIALSEEIIKLLAKRNPARCRQLLDTLFEIALQTTQGNEKSGGAGQSPGRSAIIRIVKVAATFDNKLARSYAERYARIGEDKSGGEINAAPSRAATGLYLQLATELVEKDPALAMAVAERSLGGGVVPATLIFIETLRVKDVQLANKFSLSALQSIQSRHGTDINELFLLYSYVFSPLRVPMIVPGVGIALQQIPALPKVAQARQVDPALASEYLKLASQTMLDAERYTLHRQALVAGTAGDLYFLNLIEPHVARYQPMLGAALEKQHTFLLHGLEPEQRQAAQTSAEKWNSAEQEPQQKANGDSASLNSMLRRADALSNTTQKDQLYYMAANLAVQAKNYDLASQITEKLSDKSREAGQQLIAFNIAQAEIKDGQLERAEQRARRDTDLVRRAYLFTLIADSLLSSRSKDIVRATELLQHVEQLAAKIDSNQERFSILTGAAAAYLRFDDQRAAELLREAIEVANKGEGFIGETAVTRSLMVGNFGFFYRMYDTSLTFTHMLKQQGRKNFNSTLTDVLSVKSRVARLKALIALCGGVLSQEAV